MAKKTKTKETHTRKKIDSWLINLGWNTDEDSPDCNVFTERLKTESQNKLLKGKEPDYALYKSDTDEIVAIIEAKRKGKNIEQTIDDAIRKYATPLNVPIVFASDGTFISARHINESKLLAIDGIPLNQFIDERTLLRFISEGAEISEVSEEVKYTREQLISIFKWTNDLLRKEGIREGFDRFIEFSNLLFLKLISEMETYREANGEERLLENQYCWDSFASLPPKTLLSYINDTVLPHLVSRYNHSGDVFQNALTISNPQTLKQIVDRLSGLTLINTESDIKGDAFEYFLKQSVSVGNDLGEYFTPRHIVKMMIHLTNPKFGETIYDPACGTGGFLIEAFKHIKHTCKQTKSNLEILRNKTLFGGEITNTARIAKMNMILTGDGHTNIKQGDSLKTPKNGEYDVVIANPPYGTTTDYGDYYPVSSKNAEVAFVGHMLEAMKKNGRLAFIIQEGLLFRGSDKKIRKLIIDKYRIDGIISLPKGVFLPYTPVKTYILLISNKKPVKNIWCYKIENDGFELTGLRKKISENDIPDLLEKWRTKEEGNNSWHITTEQIRENKYSIIPEDYNEKFRFKLEQAENYVPEELNETYVMLKEITTRFKKIKTSYNLEFLLDESIPKEKVCKIFNMVSGGTPSRDVSRYFDGDINWAKVGDIPGSTKKGYVQPQENYIETTEEKITESGFVNAGAKMIPKNTVLVAIFANAGKTGILKIDACTNQAIVGLIPKDEYTNKCIPEYIYYMILANRDVLMDMARGGNQVNINKTKLGDLKIPFPDKKIQKKVVKIMERYSSEVYDLLEEKVRLEERLHRIYNGILVDSLIKQKINEESSPREDNED